MKERKRADIDIFNPQGELIETVLITPSANRVVKLMDSDYITLKFSLADAVFFPVGSYCDDEIFGRFYVTQEQMPKYNTTTGGYDYELRMDAWYWLWNLKQFMMIGEIPNDAITKSYFRRETTWYHTNSLREQMRQFMRNLQVLGFVGSDYNFLLDVEGNDLDKFIEIDTANVKNHSLAILMSYSGTHLVDALKELANTWECEYWITGNEQDFTIHFGKCEVGNAVVLSLDSNVESMDINNDVSEYADKIYFYGGIDNIPNTYRKVIELYAYDINAPSGTVESFLAKKNTSDAKSARIEYSMLHNPEEGDNTNTLFEIVFDHDGDVPTDSVDFLSSHKTKEQTLLELFKAKYSLYQSEDKAEIIDGIKDGSFDPDAITWIDDCKLHMKYKDLADGSVSEEDVLPSRYLEFIDNEDIYMVSMDIRFHTRSDEYMTMRFDQWCKYAEQLGGKVNFATIYSDGTSKYLIGKLKSMTFKLFLADSDKMQFFGFLGAVDCYEDICGDNGNGRIPADGILFVKKTVTDETQYASDTNDTGFSYYDCYKRDYQGSLVPIPNTYVECKDGGSFGFRQAYYKNKDSELFRTISPRLKPREFGADRVKLRLEAQTVRIGFLIMHSDLDNTTVNVANYIGRAKVSLISGEFSWDKQTGNVAPIKSWGYTSDTKVTDIPLDYTLEGASKTPVVSFGDYAYFELTMRIEAKDSKADLSWYDKNYGLFCSVALEWNGIEPVEMRYITPMKVTMYEYSSGVYHGYMDEDNRFRFDKKTQPMATVFKEGTKFRIYADYCYKVPYAYWLNEYDDPASLLSIGDMRLQLPLYRQKAIEDWDRNVIWKWDSKNQCFQHYNGTNPDGTAKPDEWTCKDGWFYNSQYHVHFHDGYIYNEDKTVVCKDGYVCLADMLTNEKSIKEITVTDDTIYPDGKLIVKDVYTKDCKTNDDVEGEGVDVEWLWKQYHLRLCRPNTGGEDFPFMRDFILPNSTPLKVRFLIPEDMKGIVSGDDYLTMQGQCKLAGMQFEVEFNNKIKYKDSGSTTATEHLMDYAIKRNDDFGAMLPNDILLPQVGDPCVIVNWNVKALENLGLIAEAEYKLFRKAADYLTALKDGNFTFTCNMMSDFFFQLYGDVVLLGTNDPALLQDKDNYIIAVKNDYDVYAIPSLGQKVCINHKALKHAKPTRVIGMELKLDKPYDTPKMICGETEAYSRLKQLEKNITKLSK